MSQPASPAKGGASRNGHDADHRSASSSHQDPTPPKQSPTASEETDLESVAFTHITSEEEGLAAPADTLPRPLHPDLGGPLYVSSIPLRDSRYSLTLVKKAYERMRDADNSLSATHLYVLLEDARYGTQNARAANEGFQKRLQQRQKKAALARQEFPKYAAAVQTSIENATVKERGQLETLDAKIALTQGLLLEARCKPGVPRAAVKRAKETPPLASSAPPKNNKKKKKKKNPEAAETSAPQQEGENNLFSPGEQAFFTWMKTVGWKLGLGAAVGLAFALSKRYVTLNSLKQFESSALIWASVWVAIGSFAMYGLTQGLTTWWQYAAARCVEEAPSTSLLPFRRLRHTLAPGAVTTGIMVVEATIMRNQEVSSIEVTDPGNWMYFVGNLGLILAATLYAATTGWSQGYNQRMLALRQERKVKAQADARTALEASTINSADAQTAFALEDHLETLRQQRSDLLQVIAAKEKPYKKQLSRYRAEMKAPKKLSKKEEQIVFQMEEDARAAKQWWLRWHEEYADEFEPINKPRVAREAGANFIRLTNVHLPVATKTSLWERIKVYFKRLRGKRSNSEKGGSS